MSIAREKFDFLSPRYFFFVLPNFYGLPIIAVSTILVATYIKQRIDFIQEFPNMHSTLFGYFTFPIKEKTYEDLKNTATNMEFAAILLLACMPFRRFIVARICVLPWVFILIDIITQQLAFLSYRPYFYRKPISHEFMLLTYQYCLTTIFGYFAYYIFWQVIWPPCTDKAVHIVKQSNS